eukprot:scaffold207929_cov32-Prasinocladus_malaysianus.AAC.1
MRGPYSLQAAGPPVACPTECVMRRACSATASSQYTTARMNTITRTAAQHTTSGAAISRRGHAGPIGSLSFGLLADVQYADKPDAVKPSATRRYSGAVGKLRRAVEHFKCSEECREKIAFVLHLGDLIDGNSSP